MPEKHRPKPRFTEYDERVMAMITERGPILALTMRCELDIPYSTIDCVLKRLRAGGAIEYVRDHGWRLKPPAAKCCPYPYRPTLETTGGFWGPVTTESGRCVVVECRRW